MIEVPDEKTITGLTRTELIALVYALKKERDDARPLLDEWQSMSELLADLYWTTSAVFEDDDPRDNIEALRRLRKERDDARDERDAFKKRGGW
jgi:hypothetical protein